MVGGFLKDLAKMSLHLKRGLHDSFMNFAQFNGGSENLKKPDCTVDL